MKKLSYFASLAAILLFGACSSDVEELTENTLTEGNKYTINVGMPADETRLQFTGALTNLLWQEGDKIYFSTTSFRGNKPVQECIIKSGAGTKSGSFDVEFATPNEGESANDYTYKIFALGKNAKYMNVRGREGIMVDYVKTPQIQNAVNDYAHLNDYIVYSAYSLKEADVKKGVKLTSENCFLDLNIKDFPAEFKGNNYTLKFRINNIVLAVVNLKDALTAGQDNHVYFVFAGSRSLAAGEKINFEISDGTTTKVASAISESGKTYEKGKIYTATIDKDAPKALKWERGILATDVVMKYPTGTTPQEFEGWKSIVMDDGNVVYTLANGDPITDLGSALQECKASEIVVPGSISIIPSAAFMYSPDLKKVELKEGVSEIQPYAFLGCNKLEKVVIPAGVQIFGSKMFEEVRSLKYLYVYTVPTTVNGACNADKIDEYTFRKGDTSNCTLYVDTAAWAEYINGNTWCNNTFKKIVNIGK